MAQPPSKNGRSPTKGRRRSSRNLHEISQTVCAAIKEVYYDSSKQAFRRAAADLLTMYEEVCFLCIIHCNLPCFLGERHHYQSRRIHQ